MRKIEIGDGESFWIDEYKDYPTWLLTFRANQLEKKRRETGIPWKWDVLDNELDKRAKEAIVTSEYIGEGLNDLGEWEEVWIDYEQ